MVITADLVKKLREATGAGMMDCKKALTEANGDFAEAEKILKKMGLAAVAKRQDRATDNGRVFVKVAKNKAILVSLTCETDFVATNKEFIALGEKICDVALEKGYTEINDELNGMVNDLISIIKENMSLANLTVYDIAADELAAAYTHGEGSLSVLVKIKAGDPAVFEKEEVKEFANDLALHVAAFTPSYLSREKVDEKYIAEQVEIFTAQAAKLDKPAKVVEGIVKGKLNKHLSEICFLNQAFVKDDTVTVAQKAQEIAKAVGTTIEIVDYAYLKAGWAACAV
jgi:elongation factor Ts